MQEGFLIHRREEQQNQDIGYALLIAMAMTGTVWIIGTAFMEDTAWQWIIPAAAAGAFLPMVKKASVQRAIVIISALIISLSLIIFRDLITGGFLQIVNNCIRAYNYSRGTDVYYYVLPEGGSGGAAVTAAASLIFIALGFLLNILLAGRHVRLFAAFNIALILLVLFLQAAPAYMACCLPAMAAAGAVIWAGSGGYAGKQLALCLAVMLIAGTAASLAYMKWGSYKESRTASDIRGSVMGRLDAWRYGEEDSYTGSLETAASYDPGNDLRLRVSASKPGAYYLKGFVGGTYERGAWREIDPSSYNKYHEGLFEWLKSQGLLPLAQNSDYLRLLMEHNEADTDSHAVTLKVSNENANRRFDYIPYGLSHDTVEGLEGINHDMNVYGSDGGEAEYEADLYDMSTSLAIINPSWMEDAAGETIRAYREAQEEYRDFVYKYYLDTDPLIEEFLDGRLPDEEQTDQIDQTIEIRNWLADPDTADAGEGGFGGMMDRDYLYYFMGWERKGNSSFYASAAVMMYRHYGVPARYAEGYLANVKEAGKAVDVTGEAVHAWAEIYRDGIGWVPVEVTPGYYDELQIPQQTDRNDTNDPPPPQADPPKQDPPPEQEDGRQRFNTESMIRTLLILMAALMLAVLVRRWFILIRRHIRLYGGNADKAINELMKFTDRLLETGGLDEDSIPEEETSILMRYRYRGDSVSAEEFAKLRDHAYALQREVFRGKGFAGRLKMLFISVLR